MKKVIAALMTIMGFSTTQPLVAAENELTSTQEESTTRTGSYPINLSVDIGPFSGLGAAVAWRPFEHLGIRGGFHWADINLPEFEYELDEAGSSGKYGMDILYQGAHLTLDYYPFRERSFRISGGLLANQNQFSFQTSGTLEINGNTYNGETVFTDVSWDDVMPYIAIGGDLFHFDKARRWSMGVELGVAFGAAPTSTTTNPTGGIPQGDLDSLQQDFEDVFGDLEFWPILKLSVNFKF